MPETELIFSEEYRSHTETTAGHRKPILKTSDAIQKIEDETEQDLKRYISGKPRRVVVRGKIIHDQS
jgi:hypothetical protein